MSKNDQRDSAQSADSVPQKAKKREGEWERAGEMGVKGTRVRWERGERGEERGRGEGRGGEERRRGRERRGRDGRGGRLERGRGEGRWGRWG